jgi:hypothetical protein
MAKFKIKASLPDKPSELIRLAVKDLKSIEKSKKYVVYMHRYHQTVDNDMMDYFSLPEGKCAVCFAGSIMARTLKCDPKETVRPDDFDVKTERKLYALDSFRTGSIYEAFDYLKIKVPIVLEYCCNQDNINISGYEENPQQFKTDMLGLASLLEEIGL